MAEEKIYAAISKIMSSIGAVKKNKNNTQQGFAYRGIDDVMNALHPAMVENKVFAVPEILEQQREDRVTNKGSQLIYSVCKIRFRFYADDGYSKQTRIKYGYGIVYTFQVLLSRP